MKQLLIATALVGVLYGQNLRDVQVIHVGDLRHDGVREKVINLLANSKYFRVTESQDKADATLVGVASVGTADRFAMIGGMAAAGTVSYESILVRLVGKDKTVLWAWDQTKKCKSMESVCAIRDLEKAFEQAKKKAANPKK